MIDGEKVIKEFELFIKEFHPTCTSEGAELNMFREVLVLLKEQEAKTGYWIDSAGNDKCSICGAEYSDLYPDYGNTHFCPNCWAKMKGR